MKLKDKIRAAVDRLKFEQVCGFLISSVKPNIHSIITEVSLIMPIRKKRIMGKLYYLDILWILLFFSGLRKNCIFMDLLKSACKPIK